MASFFACVNLPGPPPAHPARPGPRCPGGRTHKKRRKCIRFECICVTLHPQPVTRKVPHWPFSKNKGHSGGFCKERIQNNIILFYIIPFNPPLHTTSDTSFFVFFAAICMGYMLLTIVTSASFSEMPAVMYGFGRRTGTSYRCEVKCYGTAVLLSMSERQTIDADYFVGDTRSVISVGFRFGKAADIPVTLYHEDIKKLSMPTCKVVAIFSKYYK